MNAAEDGKYLPAIYKPRLGKVKVGKSSIGFTSLEAVDFNVLNELLRKAHTLLS